MATNHGMFLCVEGSGSIALQFLTSILDGREWSASRLGRSTPGIEWKARLGSRAYMDAVKDRKSLAPAGSRKMATQSVVHRYTTGAISARLQPVDSSVVENGM
jgi:hypothetical protein